MKKFTNFPDDEDDSKPLKTTPTKSEESSTKKIRNDDEAMDETQDEGSFYLHNNHY